jgi:acetyl-CoA acetyltransferase
MDAAFNLKDQACIVGIGMTAFGRILDRSPASLQVEAFRNALADCGLERDDIDGFATAFGAPDGMDYDEFAHHAGLELRWANQNWTHGRWGSTCLSQAALALSAGLCNYVAVCITRENARGYGRYLSHGSREGSAEGLRDFTGGHGESNIHGLDTPGAATSLVAREYMHRYGATSEELGTVAVTFRKHAQLNPHATMYGRPMTLDDYLESRWITPPFRLFDYCLVNEGSICLILTTPERARALKQTPVFLSGLQGVQTSRDSSNPYARPGLASKFQTEFDYVAPEHQLVYDMAQVKQDDVDALYIYDSFSTNLWMILERYGFCKAGEAHEFIQGGRIEIGGALPVNTNGGSLSDGHYSGYNQFVEMVTQLRGDAGPRQVAGAEVLQGATGFGDSAIMTRG